MELAFWVKVAFYTPLKLWVVQTGCPCDFDIYQLEKKWNVDTHPLVPVS